MPEIFEKAAIIGTGLMGGSLSMALVESSKVRSVAGYDSSEETREKALAMRVADEVSSTASEAVNGADLVFIATPTSSIVDTFVELSGSLRDGAVVSDLGSAKMTVTAGVEAALPGGVSYVGGHPMTGSEQSGVQYARPDLYRQAYYILTPTARTDAEAFSKLHAVLTDIGARVISIDPESHDRAMATVSHVPHLLSLLLMDMASGQKEQMENLYTVSAGGFRDMTRIAASSPEVWIDICMENNDFIIERLKDYDARMRDLTEMLESGDREGLRRLFEGARRARAELSVKSGQELEELFDVSLPVPDEPGVISRISTAVGSLGVNIEDLGIVHPLEGETGIMTLRILGKEKARQAAEKLQELGYRASFWKA